MKTQLIDNNKKYYSAHFKELSLTSSEISNSIFEGCCFEECNFTETRFSKCKFMDCSFNRCNLSVLSVKGSSFTETSFVDCKAIGINWSKAYWPAISLLAPISFTNCIVSDSSFFMLNLAGLQLEKCIAHNVDFREGSFSKANFKGTDFYNSLFNNTNLIKTDFTNAVNYKINIYRNEIKDAKFSRYEATSLLDSIGVKLVD